MNHESDFFGLRRLNKEHTTSLKAQKMNRKRRREARPGFSF
jgi:hypothetical protein